MTVDESVSSRAGALHQSTVKQLTGDCSWSWYLANIRHVPNRDGPEAHVGTVYHAGVERHELARIRQAKLGLDTIGVSEDEMLSACLAELADDSNVGWRPDYGRAEGRDALVSAVHNWWHSPIPDARPFGGLTLRERLLRLLPLAVEPYFKVRHPQINPTGRPMGGWIDGVYLDPDAAFGVVVVDQKSAGKLNSYSFDDPTRTWVQATSYSLAVTLAPYLSALTDGLPPFEFHVSRTMRSTHATFEPARILPVQPTPSDVQGLTVKVQEAQRIIDEGDYRVKTRDMGNFLCSPKWCGFYEGCRTTGELAP